MNPVPAPEELLRWMVESDASDMHLSVSSPPVYRRHGVLQPMESVSPLHGTDLAAVLERVTDEFERGRLKQDRDLDKAVEISGVGRFRLNIAYERGNLYFTFRRVNERIPEPDELGLPAACARLADLPRGLVLVTGPTGSGKSTTLASMIDLINRTSARHIVTIEDPIEYVHANKRSIINQREVGSDARSFDEALRHALRQDPDVIMVGEMRDLETMSAAITAAETGHLVFATLHTVDAAQTIDRVVDAFPSHQQAQIRLQLSNVIEAALCQTLVPPASGDTRIAAFEVMLGMPAVRNLIREAKAHQISTALATGAAQGMHTLDQHLAALTRAGRISVETAQAFARLPDEVMRLIDRPLAA